MRDFYQLSDEKRHAFIVDACRKTRQWAILNQFAPYMTEAIARDIMTAGGYIPDLAARCLPDAALRRFAVDTADLIGAVRRAANTPDTEPDVMSVGVRAGSVVHGLIYCTLGREVLERIRDGVNTEVHPIAAAYAHAPLAVMLSVINKQPSIAMREWITREELSHVVQMIDTSADLVPLLPRASFWYNVLVVADVDTAVRAIDKISVDAIPAEIFHTIALIMSMYYLPPAVISAAFTRFGLRLGRRSLNDILKGDVFPLLRRPARIVAGCLDDRFMDKLSREERDEAMRTAIGYSLVSSFEERR